MFSDEKVSDKIIKSVAKLLCNEKSLFWFDYASDDLVQNFEKVSSIETFARSMSRMGEPFIRGYNNIADTLKQYGLIIKKIDSSNSYLASNDPAYHHYNFCTAKKLA